VTPVEQRQKPFFPQKAMSGRLQQEPATEQKQATTLVQGRGESHTPSQQQAELQSASS